ncbi:hypothetical protein H4R35_000592 [Dimargaris xerosporica]|nr:hypothetical protein H4R35_000592 [Dimargaris xerosporica]
MPDGNPALNHSLVSLYDGKADGSDVDLELDDILKEIAPSWSTEDCPNIPLSIGPDQHAMIVEQTLGVIPAGHHGGISTTLPLATICNGNLVPSLLAPIPCRVELPTILGMETDVNEHRPLSSAFKRPSSAQSRMAALQQEVIDLQARIKELESLTADKQTETHYPSKTMDPSLKARALEQVLLALDSHLNTISDNQRDTKTALASVVQYLDSERRKPTASTMEGAGNLPRLTSLPAAHGSTVMEAALTESQAQYDQLAQRMQATTMKASADIAYLQTQLAQASRAQQQAELQLQQTYGAAQMLQQVNGQLTLALGEARLANFNREKAWDQSTVMLTPLGHGGPKNGARALVATLAPNSPKTLPSAVSTTTPPPPEFGTDQVLSLPTAGTHISLTPTMLSRAANLDPFSSVPSSLASALFPPQAGILTM